MTRMVALCLVLNLVVQACSVSHAGAPTFEQVAGESVFQDVVPGLSDEGVGMTTHCSSRDSGDLVSDGGIIRSVATDTPLEAVWGQLIGFYSERAASDGWTIVEINESPPDVDDQPSYLMMKAERMVGEVPMTLWLDALVQRPQERLFRFELTSRPPRGTFCS